MYKRVFSGPPLILCFIRTKIGSLVSASSKSPVGWVMKGRHDVSFLFLLKISHDKSADCETSVRYKMPFPLAIASYTIIVARTIAHC
jgi:hypothetical protein